MRGACIEDVLAKRRIILLSNRDETQCFEKKYVTLRAQYMLTKGVTRNLFNRIAPVCYVLGSRGSGKTFFALLYAARVDLSNLRKTVKRASVHSTTTGHCHPTKR
jgi:NRPS condensation-like uncharacterized protein